MLITVGNVWARIAHYSQDELAFVKAYLSYRTVNHRGKTKQHSVLVKDYFPAGLARRLTRAAREAGITVELVNKQSSVVIADGYGVEGVNWTARQHQIEAIDAIRKHRRGLIQHATGAGKSDLIGLLANLIQGKVLVVSTSKKLRADLLERCAKFAVQNPVQRLRTPNSGPSRQLVVCNDDSLKNISDADMAAFDAVLCDEAHHVASPTHQAALKRCKNASIRIGFSATALNRADRKSLFTVGMLGETLHRYSPAQAAEDGVIAKAALRMPQFAHPNVIDHKDYAAWDRINIAENRLRNLAALRLVHATPSPRIVFVRTKVHQQELVRMIGANVAFVNDETDPEQADADIAKLRSGLIDTIVSTPIYRQGVDIPEIKTVINVAGGKATIDVIQKVGRGSRIRQPDGTMKETFEVYDLYDVGCGCEGELHKSCEWLKDHSESRRKAYEEFGYRVRSE